MARTEEEKLVFTLEARIRDLEKNMAKSRFVVDKTAGQIESRFAKVGKNISGSMSKAVSLTNGAIGKLGLGGLAAGGIAGIVAAGRELAASIAEVGDRAKIAGVSIQSWQELAYVAKTNRIEVDALQDGLKELSLRTSEFISTAGKSGSAADAFKRLGYTVDELKTKIKDPSALLTEIIGKVEKLDKSAQIQLFDELFGGQGGEQFVKLISQGEKGIREQIKAAHDLNQVLTDDVVKSAAEVDRKFAAIATTIGGALKSAVVDAFTYLANFIDKYREIKDQANSTIDNRVREIGLRRNDLETERFQNQGNDLHSRRKRGVIDQELRKLAEEERQLVDERYRRNETSLEPIVINSGGSYNGGDTSGLGSSATKRADEYERSSAALREQITLMQAETDAQSKLNPLIDDYGFAVEKARAAQELANAAKAAGKTITPELSAEIDKLSTAYANAVVESEKLAESQDDIRRKADEAREFNKGLTRGIVDGFMQGKKAADVFADALSKISDRLLDMAFDGLFNSKSGGGFDLFGSISSFLGIGRSSAPASVTAPVSITIDATGADAAGLARVEQQLARLKADLPATVVKTVRDAQARRGL